MFLLCLDPEGPGGKGPLSPAAHGVTLRRDCWCWLESGVSLSKVLSLSPSLKGSLYVQLTLEGRSYAPPPLERKGYRT